MIANLDRPIAKDTSLLADDVGKLMEPLKIILHELD